MMSRATDSQSTGEEKTGNSGSSTGGEARLSALVFPWYLSLVLFLVAIYSTFPLLDDQYNSNPLTNMWSSVGPAPFILGAFLLLTAAIFLTFQFGFKIGKYLVATAFAFNFILFYLSRWITYDGPIGFKPIIYIHGPPGLKDNIQVKIDGMATVTEPTPNRNTGRRIEWDIEIGPDGELHHVSGDNPSIPHLFYECNLRPIPSDGTGWLIVCRERKFMVDGREMTGADVSSFVHDILMRWGFTQEEASEFTDYWLAPETMRLFGGRTDFAVVLEPLWGDRLDETLAIETEMVYDEVVRLEVVVREAAPGTAVTTPGFPERASGKPRTSLHEWGVIMESGSG